MPSKNNPYSLIFGKEPKQLISRSMVMAEVVEVFCEEEPSQQVFMITGVRGSGKTVLMTEISKEMAKKDEWIVVELNPESDLLEGLAAKLSGENSLAALFRNAKINLSFLGLGIGIDGVAPIRDVESALVKMLESIKKQKKRVLITIDEAVNTKEMRTFASAFQIMLRKDLPVFLLMTGLYENIDVLQNEKHLTFLYRASKLELRSLNVRTIAENYKKNFRIDDGTALKMAKTTQGYSFAFQVLGYFTWENNGKMEKAIPQFRQHLEDYVYEKIWADMSANDRKLAYGIAKSKNGRVSEVREILGMETNEFNPYRKRLIRRGIVNGEERGYVRFTLPMFADFVKDMYDDGEE
ncbi:MAG: ATP-binding protein [Lachnospiraceae bacterium]|nr:ATP-binding protein [Lachnospiraceae bacterium]